MKIKYLFVVIVLATAIFGYANVVNASCIDENFNQKTYAEKIQCLTSVIADLTQQIAAIQAQRATWCHTFTNYLVASSANEEVSYLQTTLTKQGLDVSGDNSGTFGDDTAAAVVSFQAKYGIRQTGTVGPITRAKLNSIYGCNGAIPTTQTSIAINSPSGQVFPYGNTMQIPVSWTITNAPTQYGINLIILNSNGGMVGTIGGILTNINVNNYNWGYTLQPGQYKIKAQVCTIGATMEAGPTCGSVLAEGVSNYFTINGNTTTNSTITVISPNGGEIFPYGNTMLIPASWTASNIPSGAGVRLKILDNTGKTFYTSGILTGVSSYNMGIALPVGQYIVRAQICTIGATMEAGPTCAAVLASDDSNGYFSVTGSSSITITSPEAFDVWKIGEIHNITWTSTGLSDNVVIRISSPNTYAIIATVPASQGSYSWPVGSTRNGYAEPARSDYKIEITDSNNPQISDTSDAYFAIAAATP